MVIFYKKYLLIVSVINCLYLSYLNMRGFLLEENLVELTKSFTVTIFATPIILLVLFNVTLIKKNVFSVVNRNEILLLMCSITVTLMFATFMYNAFRQDGYRFLYQILSIGFEIFSILVAIKKEKERKIMELVSYFSLCFLTGILSYSTIGILEKYFDYQPLDNTLRLIFTAVFLHFFNACFLFYKSIYRSSFTSKENL